MIPIQMNSLLVPILHQRGIQDQIGLVDHWQTRIKFWNDNGMSIIQDLSRTIFFDMPYYYNDETTEHRQTPRQKDI